MYHPRELQLKYISETCRSTLCDVCSWSSVVMCSRGASLIFNEMAAVPGRKQSRAGEGRRGGNVWMKKNGLSLRRRLQLCNTTQIFFYVNENENNRGTLGAMWWWLHKICTLTCVLVSAVASSLTWHCLNSMLATVLIFHFYIFLSSRTFLSDLATTALQKVGNILENQAI